MKYLKYFEVNNKDDNKRMGLYSDISDILNIYKYLKDKKIRFMTLFGNDDVVDDDCFLILIEGNDYSKLPYISENGFKDYYITVYDDKGFSDNYFFNWFELNKIQGNWKVINNLEEIEIILNSKKYNL